MISHINAVKFGIGAIVSYCLLTLLMVFFGEYFLKLLLPFYAFAIDTISTELQVKSISLGLSGTTKQIMVVVSNPFPLYFSTATIPIGVPIQLVTLQGHALQHFIVIYSILFSYPPVIDKKKPLLLLTSTPFLIFIEFIDIPVVLLGSGYDLIYSNFNTQLISNSPMIIIMDFLNGGGRLAISITAAICSIGTYKILGFSLVSK